MRLAELVVEKFRNLSQVQLRPSAHATIAVGQNGQGKTNLLEAIYFLATLKPLRTGKLQELVQFGEAGAAVQGDFLLGGVRRQIRVEIAEGKRQALVDGKRVAKLEEYFGGVSVVAFTPEDLAVVKGAPEMRRWFLDRAVFNRFPAYLQESRDYARALKSRNRLIRERASADYLESFDAPLATLGARLLVRRRSLLEELAPRAQAAFAHIAKIDAPARFRYRPRRLALALDGASEEALAAALLSELSERTDRDRERGFTSVGPHADDLAIDLGEHPARAFASQGQQRALILAWKVAEIENLQAALGYLPLLLLDDVSSELDPERNAYLMQYLAKSGAQVFLTTTDGSLVKAAASEDTLWLTVNAGQVAPTEGDRGNR